MQIIRNRIENLIELGSNIFLLKVHSPELSGELKPGQFLNVKVSDSNYPLLRRPFSICDVEGECIFLMFNLSGEGTKVLAKKRAGDELDILGPLGCGFNLNGDFDAAVIAAGGLGAAPFPYLTRMLLDKKTVHTFIGGKSRKDIIKYGMKNVHTATDDGSDGFKGTVVGLLENKIDRINANKIKIFGCGPSQMLTELKNLSIKHNFECEVSTECAMACGFGICQGCPIQSAKNPDKYLLVCKDGPVFNVRDIQL